MKKIFLILVMSLVAHLGAFAQGCVAIRSNGGVCTMDHPMNDSVSEARGWQLNSAYRYFKSFRHFRGNEEEEQRLIDNTEVINWQSTLDLTLIRQLNNKWSISVGVPVVVNKRSSLYEHGRTERHNSNSNGIGDIRLVANRWMLSPKVSAKGNFQLGVGVKLPTGKAGSTDLFYNVGANQSNEIRPVDQSIQPGDGGLGAITEFNGYYNLSSRFSAYANLFYLINPREQNGIRTYRETLSPRLANESIMSVPDQYMARLGLHYSFEKSLKPLSVALGGRIEGIPVYDLIGGSGGFRRPGYVFSVEPAATYQYRQFNFFAAVPVALSRNRLQSITDKESSAATGTFVQGDAAFADYAVNLGFVYKF